jgi:hypothetical protein
VVVSYNWGKPLTYPMDHYATFRGQRIFGQNKTYRGLVVMMLASIGITYFYAFLVQISSSIASVNLLTFDTHSPFFYGCLYGIGYVVGELPNSFIKRQLAISEGKSNGFIQRLIDQLDSVVVILLMLIFTSNFTWTHFWIGLVFYGLLHLSINYGLFLLKLRKEPY